MDSENVTPPPPPRGALSSALPSDPRPVIVLVKNLFDGVMSCRGPVHAAMPPHPHTHDHPGPDFGGAVPSLARRRLTPSSECVGGAAATLLRDSYCVSTPLWRVDAADVLCRAVSPRPRRVLSRWPATQLPPTACSAPPSLPAVARAC
jgi:hypothetical protein